MYIGDTITAEAEIIEINNKKRNWMSCINIAEEEYENSSTVLRKITNITIKHLLTNYIEQNSISFAERIDIIISFGKILESLHNKDISHRDIKPLNLYMLNKEPYFGDYGLVDFPDKVSDFTKSDKGFDGQYNRNDLVMSI